MPWGFNPEDVKLTEEGQRVFHGGEPKPYDYTPPLTQKQAAEQMPNYDKLTRAERWAFEALPAVGEGVEWVKGKMESSWLGRQALWAGSWAGKALQVLDVGAEGLERTLGLAVQYGNALKTGTTDDFKNNLANAWYAGSLFADASALPKFTGMNEDGSWSGIQLPTYADGQAQIQAMMTAQNRIRDLVELEGYNRKDALEQARAEYYDSLGALAFRAQLHDTILHIGADPLNLILPQLQLVDRLHVARSNILATKGISALDNIDDLGRMDRFIIAATGGTATTPSAISKIPVLGKAFSITPESRALEYMTTISDNVDNYILAKFDDPREIVETIMRAQKGSLGPEFGHAFVTLEGRTAQATLSSIDIKAKELLGTYEFIAPHRAWMNDVGMALDMSPASIVGMLQDETQSAGFLRRLAEAGIDAPKNIIEDIAKFADDVPYTPAQFKHYLSNLVKDAAAQQAVLQFGVKSRGLIQKASYAMKSAETLAFLRLNPGFAVKNFFNNEFTMIARGVGGYVGQQAIDDLVEVLGFAPHRMSQAFTMAGESVVSGAKTMASGEKIIAEALRGEPGFLGKAFDGFRDFANSVQIGPEVTVGGKKIRPLDMGDWASRAEQSASRRAFYNGYTEGWRKFFWKPGKGFTQARDGLTTIADDAILNSVDDIVAGAKSEKEIEAAIRGGRRSGGAIRREAERRVGREFDEVLESVGITNLDEKLTVAVEKGPDAVRDLFRTERANITSHMDEVAAANHAVEVEKIAATVQWGGPDGLILKYGDMIDDIHGTRLAHNLRMSKIERPGADFADVFWERTFKENDAIFKRMWDRQDDAIRGFEQGVKNNGMDFPKEIKTTYRQIRKQNDEFFKMRNQLRREFFKAERAGKTPKLSWDEINARLDDAYDNLIQTERIATQEIDDIVTGMVRQQNPELANAYATWRAKARELSLVDKEEVAAFMREIRNMPSEEIALRYNEFYRKRAQRLTEMWQNERAGVAMMSGTPGAEIPFDKFMPGFMGSEEAAQQARMLAKQYGVVDKAGEPVFYQLKNIVNKYMRGGYADEAIEGALQYERITEVPPEMFEKALEARRQWAIAQEGAEQVAKAAPRPQDIINKKTNELISKSVDELDDMTRNAIQQEAAIMRYRLELSEPGQRFYDNTAPNDPTKFIPNSEEQLIGKFKDPEKAFKQSTGGFIGKVDSTYPSWYADVGASRQQTINALNKIMEGGGKDYGVYVERLKQLAINNIESGERDIRLLIGIGMEDDAFDMIHKAVTGGTLDDLMRRMEGDADTVYKWYMDNYAKFTDEAGNFVPQQEWDFSVGPIPGFDDIPEQVAKELIDVTPPKPPDTPTLSDPRVVTKDIDAMQPPYWEMDQRMMQSGYEMLDELERTALDPTAQAPLKWDDLTPEQADDLERYIARVKGEMADARYASIRYGEYKRDSALLNYNRRYNYNTFLGALAPFEFWTTQSIMKWAIHSIDRPAMLSNYLRMKKFITQAGAPNTGFPTRLKNSIRIPMPFMPDWMGNSGVYVDPLRFALPFDAWATAPEQYMKDRNSMDARVERYIEDQISEGAISSEDGLNAIQTRQGQVWEQAKAMTMSMEESGQTDAFDYMSLFVSPHAPLQWAYKAATGQKEDIGPLTPFGRNVRQLQGLLGIGAADPKKGVWGNIRQELGLPAYDKWDDYRIERMVSNMVASQEITPDMAMRALIEKEGPVWDEAAKKAAKEYAGGGVGGFLFKMLGIPTQTYPEGEMIQRSLQDDFSRAYEAYQGGNVEALTTFFDKHPEYESRLALWDKPEERMHKFLVDEIWSRYNEMPKVYKDQLKENFGDTWQMLFLNKETRNTDNIPTETLQVWLKLMGGDPPGTLSGPAVPIDFAPPEEAWRVQQFYELRKQMFPDYYEQQDEYFKLDESARRAYRNQTPALTDYWNWRNDFLHRNPDVAGYVTDDYEFEYGSAEEYRQAQAAQPQLTRIEWDMMLGDSVTRVLEDGDVPEEARLYLETQAERLGMTLQELISAIRNSQ